MLLLGGEINSEIEAAVKEKKLAGMGVVKPDVTAETATFPSVVR
jgi:hypothetical protein